MTVKNTYGTEINYDAAGELMDDEKCEALSAELAACTEKEFFTAYAKAHTEKFGEAWELDKENPVY